MILEGKEKWVCKEIVRSIRIRDVGVMVNAIEADEELLCSSLKERERERDGLLYFCPCMKLQ